VDREFGFELWPTHNASRYSNFVTKLKQETEQNYQQNQHKTLLIGSDISQAAIDAANANLQIAKTGYLFKSAVPNITCSLQKGSFEDVFTESIVKQSKQVNSKVTILSNLPYGVREEKVRSVLTKFGSFIRKGNILQVVDNIYVLNGNDHFYRNTSLSTSKWTTICKFLNNGIPVELLKFNK